MNRRSYANRQTLRTDERCVYCHRTGQDVIAPNLAANLRVMDRGRYECVNRRKCMQERTVQAIAAAEARRAARVAELEATDRLAHGASEPGGPGACGRPGCGHAKVWHGHTDRRRPCERCGCASWITAPELELSPAGQLDLYGADAGQIFGQLPMFGGAA